MSFALICSIASITFSVFSSNFLASIFFKGYVWYVVQYVIILFISPNRFLNCSVITVSFWSTLPRSTIKTLLLPASTIVEFSSSFLSPTSSLLCLTYFSCLSFTSLGSSSIFSSVAPVFSFDCIQLNLCQPPVLNSLVTYPLFSRSLLLYVQCSFMWFPIIGTPLLFSALLQ